VTRLCCDCQNRQSTERRCEACGSPRLLSHPEQFDLSIAHIDCDAFYAAVEKRDRPELANSPVIIGGGQRGVVSTACYIARIFGVRSAMPMFKALALCPNAVVLRPDMAKYSQVGREVRMRMLELTPLVEPLSIDEAFLDMSGTSALHKSAPAETLLRFQAAIERDIGITVSIGLSHNKFLAKVASDLDKPRGFSIIGKQEAAAFLSDKSVALIWGVGKAMQEKLGRDGIRLIGDLQQRDLASLMRSYGNEGTRLYNLSRGIDPRRVTPERETKSVSAETTFNADLRKLEDLRPILWTLCEKVHDRMKAQGLSGQGVTLKLKTADFRLLTRNRMLSAPTQLAKRIFDPALDLLKEVADGATSFRLIGVGMSSLADATEADRGDLVDTGIRKDAATEAAIDSIRQKFGSAAVLRGTALPSGAASLKKRQASPDVSQAGQATADRARSDAAAHAQTEAGPSSAGPRRTDS
jgi:DNA polymerase IV